MTTPSQSVKFAIARLKADGVEVDTGHWQGVSTAGHPDLVTREITNLHLDFEMPLSADEAVAEIGPNMPWAEDHFQERVSRVPSNPGEEYKNWPWWHGGFQEAKSMTAEQQDANEFKFTHTYQERFWPKHVRADWESQKTQEWERMKGIRYEYGDLDDVVNLLRREPYTRQATFPIFFPEDTGAVHGGRIPCTLHYHFLMRRNKLDLYYPIRSCDAVRHFRDDLYMAVRLCQWVLAELKRPLNMDGEITDRGERWAAPWQEVEPGILHFTAYSFHVHKGDAHLL